MMTSLLKHEMGQSWFAKPSEPAKEEPKSLPPDVLWDHVDECLGTWCSHAGLRSLMVHLALGDRPLRLASCMQTSSLVLYQELKLVTRNKKLAVLSNCAQTMCVEVASGTLLWTRAFARNGHADAYLSIVERPDGDFALTGGLHDDVLRVSRGTGDVVGRTELPALHLRHCIFELFSLTNGDIWIHGTLDVATGGNCRKHLRPLESAGPEFVLEREYADRHDLKALGYDYFVLNRRCYFLAHASSILEIEIAWRWRADDQDSDDTGFRSECTFLSKTQYAEFVAGAVRIDMFAFKDDSNTRLIPTRRFYFSRWVSVETPCIFLPPQTGTESMQSTGQNSFYVQTHGENDFVFTVLSTETREHFSLDTKTATTTFTERRCDQVLGVIGNRLCFQRGLALQMFEADGSSAMLELPFEPSLLGFKCLQATAFFKDRHNLAFIQ